MNVTLPIKGAGNFFILCTRYCCTSISLVHMIENSKNKASVLLVGFLFLVKLLSRLFVLTDIVKIHPFINM